MNLKYLKIFILLHLIMILVKNLHPSDKNIIIEALKIKDINNIDNNNLISINDRDTLIKFRQFY